MKNKFISSIWDFTKLNKKDTGYASHDLLRWYGKLIPSLVNRIIDLYSKKNDTVLANFAGSGTVLVEANIMNRNSIGIDSSPLSNLVCKVKTSNYIPDHTKFLSSVEKYLNKNETKNFLMDEVDKKWYDKITFRDLMLTKEKINDIENPKEQNYYLLVLCSCVRLVSRIDSRCINHMVVDKNKKPINVFKLFQKKAEETNNSIKEFKELSSNLSPLIINGDAKKINEIKNNSVDLIISHPPYLGHIMYSNIFCLPNKLLGYDYSFVKENDISTTSVKKYMDNMKQVFDEMYRVIKPDKYACVIIGDNRKNGNIVPTFSYFIEYASEIGFNLKDIFIWVTSKKAGMNIKRHGNHIDHNYILIFKKD